MKLILILVNLSCFLHKVASLGLTVQTNAFATKSSLLLWSRQSSDKSQELNFDLRLIYEANKTDAGVAVAEIHASPTQQFGTAQIIFPRTGTYQVTAVNDQNNTLGTSNDVVVIPLPSPSAIATPMSNLLVSHSTNKAPVIIGSIIATLVLLTILVALVIFLSRRRTASTSKRWTFHRDMMVQKPLPPILAKISPRSSLSVNTAPRSNDPEQGLVSAPVHLPSQSPEPQKPDPVVYAARLTGPRGSHRPALLKLEWDFSHHPQPPRPPIGPRLRNNPQSPFAPRVSLHQSARPISPALRSPSPRTHRQRAIADQIEMLRIQMLEFERAGGKEVVTMDEMSEKMAWLREQQEGSWALGLTEVTPPGFSRYMT